MKKVDHFVTFTLEVWYTPWKSVKMCTEISGQTFSPIINEKMNKCYNYKVFMGQSSLPAAPWWMSWPCWRHELHREEIYYISTMCTSGLSLLFLSSFFFPIFHSNILFNMDIFHDMMVPFLQWSYLGFGLTKSKEGNNGRKKDEHLRCWNTLKYRLWAFGLLVVCSVWLSTAVINHMLDVIHDGEAEPSHYWFLG